MAINIFNNEVEKASTKTSGKLIEAFRLFLKYREQRTNVIQLFKEADDKLEGLEKILYMDKETYEFKIEEFTEDMDLTDKLPVIINNEYDNHQPLLAPHHTLNIIQFLQTNVEDDNVVQNLVTEFESLKDQLLTIKTKHDDEDDATIDISVYPTVKDYIDQANNIGISNFIDENRVYRNEIETLVRNTFHIAKLSDVKSIKHIKGNEEYDTLVKLEDLDKESKIEYQPMNQYYAITNALNE